MLWCREVYEVAKKELDLGFMEQTRIVVLDSGFKRFLSAQLLLAMILLLLLASSCIGDLESEVCPYNVRIVYRYNRENTTKDNVINLYIGSLTEYIYDDTGRLVTSHRITDGLYADELELPAGRYTIVAWGNMSSKSAVRPPVSDGQGLSDTWVYPVNLIEGQPDNYGPGDRLYYGYRTFTVNEKNTSHIYVDMEHAYCQMNLNIYWKGQAAKNGLEYTAILSGVPSRTSFYPAYNFIGGGVVSYPPENENFPVNTSSEPCSFLPVVNGLQEPLIYRQGLLRLGNQATVQFVTQRYRFRTDDKPLELAFYTADGSLACKKIDLYKYFRELNYQLDTYRRQEFNIVMEIDGDNIKLIEVGILDWADGGSLGGW